MNRRLFLKLWSIAAGSMDACTGALLVFFPSLTLRLMNVPVPDEEAMTYLSWMGVFVAAIGLSYVLVLINAGHGETVWLVTAMSRILVAGFVVAKITSGMLAPGWWLVAVTDAGAAIVQIAVLRAGWWKGDGR